jgi:hypothetical protein
MSREIDHAKLLKLKQKKMFQDVDKKKHFINYKNDWLFRQDVGFEPFPCQFPAINLQPPVMYNTIVEPQSCSNCHNHSCYDC